MKSLLRTIVTATCQVKLINLIAMHPECHFKVGKTTQTLSNRFSECYEDEYDDIELLYDASTDGELIDNVEEDMIVFCKETYLENCDNEQVGGGPSCKDNVSRDNTAKLYVVWKD